MKSAIVGVVSIVLVFGSACSKEEQKTSGDSSSVESLLPPAVDMGGDERIPSDESYIELLSLEVEEGANRTSDLFANFRLTLVPHEQKIISIYSTYFEAQNEQDLEVCPDSPEKDPHYHQGRNWNPFSIEPMNDDRQFTLSLSPYVGYQKICVWVKDDDGQVSNSVSTHVYRFKSEPPEIESFRACSKKPNSHFDCDTKGIDKRIYFELKVSGNQLSMDVENLLELEWSSNLSDRKFQPYAGSLNNLKVSSEGNATANLLTIKGYLDSPTDQFFVLKAVVKNLDGNRSGYVISSPAHIDNKIAHWKKVVGNEAFIGVGEGVQTSRFNLDNRTLNGFDIDPVSGEFFLVSHGSLYKYDSAKKRIIPYLSYSEEGIKFDSQNINDSLELEDEDNLFAREIYDLVFRVIGGKRFLFLFSGAENSDEIEIYRINLSNLKSSLEYFAGSLKNSAADFGLKKVIGPTRGSNIASDGSFYFFAKCAPYKESSAFKLFKVNGSSTEPGALDGKAQLVWGEKGNRCKSSRSDVPEFKDGLPVLPIGQPLADQIWPDDSKQLLFFEKDGIRHIFYTPGKGRVYRLVEIPSSDGKTVKFGLLQTAISDGFRLGLGSLDGSPSLFVTSFEGGSYRAGAYSIDTRTEEGSAEVLLKALFSSSREKKVSSCNSDGVSRASACVTPLTSVKQDIGGRFFVTDGERQFRIRFVDAKDTVQTLLGQSEMFRAWGKDASVLRPHIEGVAVGPREESRDVGRFDERLYFLDPDAAVLAHVEETGVVRAIWVDPNVYPNADNRVGKQNPKLIPVRHWWGSMHTLNFDAEGLLWVRNGFDLFSVSKQFELNKVHSDTQRNWFDANHGDPATNFSMRYFGTRSNLIFGPKDSGIFLLGGYSEYQGDVYGLSKVSLKYFDYIANEVTHILGSQPNKYSKDIRKGDSEKLRTLSLDGNCLRERSCFVDYDSELDRLYFSEGSRIRYVGKPFSDDANLVTVCQDPDKAEIKNLSVRKTGSKFAEFFYVKQGDLFRHTIMKVNKNGEPVSQKFCDDEKVSPSIVDQEGVERRVMPALPDLSNQFSWRDLSSFYLSASDVVYLLQIQQGRLSAQSFETIPKSRLSNSGIKNAKFGYQVAFKASCAGDYAEVILLEDDKPLGPADSSIDDIMTLGMGRTLYEKDEDDGEIFYFSSSDNSNPIKNGRFYSWVCR